MVAPWRLPGRPVPADRTDRDIGLTDAPPTDVETRSAWSADVGTRASVETLLADLDRRARPARPPLARAVRAFRWDETDSRTRAWMPQGVSSSADAAADGTVAGRHVVAVSWYARRDSGSTPPTRPRSRVTFVDVTDPGDVPYRHVLLVAPSWDAGTGRSATLPVAVHAGGLAWYGGLLYVASTYGGLRVFDLADLVRVDPAVHHGFAYLLPQCSAYQPVGDPQARMRYSFVSLDRTSAPHSLLAGEYGRGDAPTQIARFALEADGRLAASAGVARPSQAFRLDVRSMQGVACVDGAYFITSSRSRFLRGDLWTGDPYRGFRRHRCALPAGPEDLAAWPSRQELWTLTEWPRQRVVLALSAGDWRWS